MKDFVLFKYSLTNGLFWGLFAGLLYAFIHSFDPSISLMTKQLIDLLFYLTFVIVSALTLKLNDTDNKYVKIFLTTAITFLLIFSSNPLRLTIINPFYRDDFNIPDFFMLSLVGFFLCGVLTFLVTRRR